MKQIIDTWRPSTRKKTRWERFFDRLFGMTSTAAGEPTCPGCGAVAKRYWCYNSWGWRCPHADEPGHHTPIGSM